MQRRRLFTLGLAGTALLAVGGGVAAWSGPAWKDGRLTPAGRALHGALMQAFQGDQPVPAATLAASLTRLEATVAGLPARSRAELAQLGALLLHPLGRRALMGLASDWSEARPAEVLAALDSMRLSTTELREQAYHGLRQLTMGVWYADPASWQVLGYPGPRDVNV